VSSRAEGRSGAASDAQRLLDQVRADVASVLRVPEHTVHPDRPLDQLGMDSLVAVDIRRRLEQRLQLQLPATVVFDHPSCRALATFLLGRLPRAADAESHGGSSR
jgi:acyl carrier protein